MAKMKSGRKEVPKNEKKESVATYHRPCDLEKIGGREGAREIASAAIEKAIKRAR